MGASVISELQELEAARGKLAKLALLRQASDLTIATIAAAVDPWQIWYVSGPPTCADPPGSLTGDAAAECVLAALSELATGALRGSESQRLLGAIWSELGSDEREWLGRVIRKKLRIGVGATLLNEVRPGTVREFDLPLCESLTATFAPDGTIEWVGRDRPEYPSFADVKLDGLRVLGIRREPSGDWELYTRGGELIETMPGAAAALREAVPSALGSVIVHGEGYGSSWSDSASSIMAKKRGRAAGDAGKPLWLFDIVPLAEFDGTSPPVTPLFERRATLESLFAGRAWEHLRLVPSEIVSSDADVASAFATAVSLGEGLVIKKRAGLPHVGRSSEWLKLKPLRSWEGVVVGWFGGKAGTRLEGSFGGFLVRLPESGAVTEVGSGMSDAQRAEYAAQLARDPTALDGKWVEVEGQPPLTDDGKIRFPVFLRERSPRDLG